MSKTLVIVESPTKAKTITKFLGSEYQVESSFGHLRDLPKSKMGIDIEGGTFEPDYIVPKDKSKHANKLKSLADKSDAVIFATDEDREGEAISWHLAKLFDIDAVNAKRIVFHEITKDAIQEAMRNPRTIDLQLVDAQQARRVLDRLVGYELSPFLWKKVARGLSAGRVQSVAVRLVVEREREIRAFKAEEYWKLIGTFTPKEGEESDAIEGKLVKIDNKTLKKFDLNTKEQMDAIVTDLANKQYTIDDVETKEQKRTPPPAFTTSQLQQQANNVYGFSAKQTMRLAQQLYEGIDLGDGAIGLITYMRTDSTNLSVQFLNDTNKYVRDTFGDSYHLDKARHYTKKTKGAQEAHEAIRPTNPHRSPELVKQYLDARQYRLYTLIWNRAVATQMAAARINKSKIELSADKYTFRASGQTCVFDGWLRLYPNLLKEEMLPTLNVGQAMNCKKLTPSQHFTKPPARYSDATLVKALEERGIGRPSTYAPTIGTIEARNYVERDEQKRIMPTDVAGVVTDLLVEHFPQIVDFEFTASMESQLDEVATGERAWKPMIKDFYEPFHKKLEKKTEEVNKEDVVNMREVGTDPETNKPVYARVGRYGPFVQLGSKDDEEKPRFAKLAKGQSIETITLEEALILLSLPKILGQDADGNDIEVNVGRFGPYVKVDGTFYSIKEDDPYTLTLDRAKEIVKAGKEEKAKRVINEFPNEDFQVLRGPFGPYIKAVNKNVKIPKDTDPEKLTAEECKELIEKAPMKKRRGGKKKKK